MSTYAEEREYTYRQKAYVVAEYVRRNKRVRTIDVAQVLGCHRQTAWRILCDLSGVMPMYYERWHWIYYEDE